MSSTCLDSQTLKSTEIAGGDYDGAKRIKGRKRHVLVDSIGLLLLVVVTAVSLQDRDGASLLLSRLSGSCKKLLLIWVDGGYLRELLNWVAERFRFRLRVVLRPKEKKGGILDARITDWVVERTLGWLNQYRRLSKDARKQ